LIVVVLASAGLGGCKPVEVIGFDCTGPELEVSAVSLTGVRPCPSPEEYGEVEVKTVQVVQSKLYTKIHIKTCLVQVTRHVTYCGQGSHTAQVKDGIREYVKFVGRDGCLAMHAASGLQFGNTWIDSVLPNSTRYAIVTLAGTVDSEGYCTGGSYADNGLTYSAVLVTANVKISINDYYAYSSLKGGELSLRSGETCDYFKNYCVQYQAGEVVWNAEPRGDCRATEWDVLFEGPANYTVVPGVQNITYALVADGTSVFALQLLRLTSLCGQTAYSTEHDRIMVIEKSKFGFAFNQNADQNPVNADTLAYYNTKASAQEIVSLKRINDLQTQSIYGRCKVQRDLLLTKLAMARTNPEAVVRAIKGDPGYSGVVLGELLFISKCSPVSVTLRNDTGRCYNQLAVTWKGESWFLDSHTKILVKFGEEVTCSEIITPTHYLDGHWVAFSPGAQKARLVPEVLAPEHDHPITFRPLHEVATGGLYSADIMRKLQTSMQFQNQRSVAMNVITKRVMGEDADLQGYKVNNLFTTEGLEALSQSMLGRIGGFFNKFGDICSIFIGVACLGYFVKMVLDVTFYGRLLYGVFGCGWALLAGMCTGMAGAMLHGHHARQWAGEARRREAQRDPERGEVTEVLVEHPGDVQDRYSGRPVQRQYDEVPTRRGMLALPAPPPVVEQHELQEVAAAGQPQPIREQPVHMERRLRGTLRQVPQGSDAN
jgi:hypothetical protein